MSHVTAKVASTLLIGVAAAAVLTAVPSRIVNAADSCLTEPKGDTQGKHWYYHIERGTGRHCWYQRGQDDDTSARADDDKQAASDQAPSSQADATAARTFADAHAEIAPKPARPDSTNAAAAPSVWPAPQASSAPANNATAPAQAAPDSTLASRWPQSAEAVAPAPSASPPPDATLMTADAQDNAANANTANPDTANTADVPPPPDAVPAPPQRQMGSIQKLLMVAFGALTLAGLTGSAVYRLGRRRRRNDWLRERNAWQEAQNPNRPPWVDEPRLYANQDVADLDDRQIVDDQVLDRQVLDRQVLDRQVFDNRRVREHVREPASDFSLAMSETEAGTDRVEKIEDFLARLTEQLHQELESSRPHRA